MPSEKSLMLTIAEGNPGALTVVQQLGYRSLVKLEQTVLRGSMVWVGYKDICNENIHEFVRALHRDKLEKEVQLTPAWRDLHRRK